MEPWCTSRGQSFASRERRTDWGAKSDGVGGLGEVDGSIGDDLDDVRERRMTQIGGGSPGNAGNRKAA